MQQKVIVVVVIVVAVVIMVVYNIGYNTHQTHTEIIKTVNIIILTKPSSKLNFVCVCGHVDLGHLDNFIILLPFFVALPTFGFNQNSLFYFFLFAELRS